MPQQRFGCTRLSHPHMTHLSHAFSVTFTTSSLSTPAAYGCLKPAPTSRLRRTYLQSQAQHRACSAFLTQPRTDPHERHYRMRLLSWMNGVKANSGVRVQDA